MAHEIYDTSAPEGVRPGQQGFCTVGTSAGIPRPLWDRLESLSGYRHPFGAAPDRSPAGWAHWLLDAGGREISVLSRLCDSGLDYTQRTNSFAHHLALEPDERAAAGPAWMLRQEGVMVRQWDGRVGPITRRLPLPRGDAPPAPCGAWQRMTGDAGWAGVLAETAVSKARKPVCILFNAGFDLLPLIAEAIALLPQRLRWQATFNTYFTSAPGTAECAWRCCLADSPAAQEAVRRASGSLVLDLTNAAQLGAPPAGPWVEAARAGRSGATGAAPMTSAPAARKVTPKPPGRRPPELIPLAGVKPPVPARPALAALPAAALEPPPPEFETAIEPTITAVDEARPVKVPWEGPSRKPRRIWIMRFCGVAIGFVGVGRWLRLSADRDGGRTSIPTPPPACKMIPRPNAPAPRSNTKQKLLRKGPLIAALSVACLVLIGFVAAFIWRLHVAAEIRWAQRIHGAVAANDLVLARKTVEDQEREAPNLTTTASVAQARGELAVLQQKADTDSAMLRSALGWMRDAVRKSNAAVQAEEAAADNPASTASLDGLRDAESAISDALARGAKIPDLSWVDPHSSVPMATKDLEARRADLKDRLDRGVLARVRAAADRANQLDPDAASPALDAVLAEVGHDLTGLRGYIRNGSDAASAADAAGRKIASYLDSTKKRQAFADALKALPADIGDAASAKEALSNFARRFPTSPVSKDVRKALVSVDLYKSVEDWYTTCRRSWLTDPAPANDKLAQQRLDQVHAFLRDYPASPDVPRASAYADYLQQAADAMAVQNTWQTALNDDLSSPLIADLKFVQTTDGVPYYIMGALNAHKRQLNGRIIYTFDTLDPQNLTHKRQITLLPPTALTNETPQPMPHALFTQALAEQLKTVERSNWDTFGIDLAAQIAAAQQIDTVVKAILLRDTITATDKSLSWAGIDDYEKPVADLARQKLDQVVWYDTEHPVAPALVGNLTRIFNEVPKPGDVKKKLEARKADLFKTLRPKFDGYGLLLRDDAGKWTIRARGVPRPGATAVVIVAAGHAGASAASQPGDAGPATAPADSSKFVTIGEWKGGTWIVDDSAVSDLPQGTLLLIAKP